VLAEKIDEFSPRVWMINTGWTGGPYGVGHRIRIPHTRAMLNAALDGLLDDVEYREDPVFALQVPVAIQGVPDEILIPRNTWKDEAAFDVQAKRLAAMFQENFAKYAAGMSQAVGESGPRA
jgi:phosphoenolpyruvate carboxykinase (ATP)